DPVDCEKLGPILSLGLVTDAASCSISDGSIKVTASGGKEPYEFSLNDLPGQSDGQFNNVSAGIYTVILKDANGCSFFIENVAVKAADFSFDANITADNSCTSGNGAVVIEVSAGNPPYTYKLGNGTFADNNSFAGLSSGNHTISVKDNNGCSVSLSVTVPRGFTGTSWSNEIKPIMEKSCALSGCHNGSSRPDLRLFEKAKFYAKSIKSKTQDKSMPREGSLTQQQIDIIACWVDDGAIEN
ncbi:MAG TPA: SprB repeat-containing protein, partial [Ferruginibacter sp.]|nr:SprB repeat-containing protein [Ferruginibacter sp.]